MAKQTINFDKHIWEGWTVRSFIDDLEPMFDQVQSGNSWMKKMTTRDEVKEWCMTYQPHYKKYIKDVVDYFTAKL